MQTSHIVIRIDYIECIGLYEILYEECMVSGFLG